MGVKMGMGKEMETGMGMRTEVRMGSSPQLTKQLQIYCLKLGLQELVPITAQD